MVAKFQGDETAASQRNCDGWIYNCKQTRQGAKKEGDKLLWVHRSFELKAQCRKIPFSSVLSLRRRISGGSRQSLKRPERLARPPLIDGRILQRRKTSEAILNY